MLQRRMWSGFSSEIETAPNDNGQNRLRRRMWSGFSSEIETIANPNYEDVIDKVACGAASHLRLKHIDKSENLVSSVRRMWSGFSSEIETLCSAM